MEKQKDFYWVKIVFFSIIVWIIISGLYKIPESSYDSYPAPTLQPLVTVNVKDFGAKGDGKTDDTVAINTAMETATFLSNNVSVIFPSGIYIVTGIFYPGGSSTIEVK